MRCPTPSQLGLRAQVEALISRAFGRSEEHLFASGVLDSLRAIELAVLLEREFGISMNDVSLDDLESITSIVEMLGATRVVRQAL